jgi:hypothetical protein
MELIFYRGNMRYWLWFSLLIVLTLTSTAPGAQWEIRKSKHCAVYFHTGDGENVSGIMAVIEERLPDLEQKLGIIVPNPAQIYLANNQTEFDQLTGGVLPPWSQGVSYPDKGVIVLKSAAFSHDIATCNRTALHEMVHLLLGYQTNSQIPRWIGEGLAMSLSGEGAEKSKLPIARALWSGKLIPLDDIDRVDSFTSDRAELAYLQSMQAVEFLTLQYGWEALSKILTDVKKGISWNDALSSETGVDQAGFEAEWKNSLSGSYRWMILLDFNFYLFTGMTALAITAGIILMRRRRKTIRRWELEDEGEQSVF